MKEPHGQRSGFDGKLGSFTPAQDLGIGRLAAGPLARFVWTPRFQFLRATSKASAE